MTGKKTSSQWKISRVYRAHSIELKNKIIRLSSFLMRSTNYTSLTSIWFEYNWRFFPHLYRLGILALDKRSLPIAKKESFRLNKLVVRTKEWYWVKEWHLNFQCFFRCILIENYVKQLERKTEKYGYNYNQCDLSLRTLH